MFCSSFFLSLFPLPLLIIQVVLSLFLRFPISCRIAFQLLGWNSQWRCFIYYYFVCFFFVWRNWNGTVPLRCARSFTSSLGCSVKVAESHGRFQLGLWDIHAVEPHSLRLSSLPSSFLVPVTGICIEYRYLDWLVSLLSNAALHCY